MRVTMTISAFALVVATTSTSMAYTMGYWRCTDDQFPYSGPNTTLAARMALARTHWAQNAYSATGNTKYWLPELNKDITDAATLYNWDLYPAYMDTVAPGMPTWKGPGPNGAGSLWGNTYLSIKSKDRTLKPAAVEIAGLCESGCYMPDQEVRMASGFVPIIDAYQADMREVTTLSPTATFDRLSFIPNDVARYSVDIAPAEQEILTLRTASGGELQVTTQHPILTIDGVMKQAKSLSIGEQLVREDGSPDPVVSIERRTAFTKVYNLRPVTTDLTSNILVAQGFLTGSNRYQMEFLQYLNRVILRRKIPSEVLPRSGPSSLTEPRVEEKTEASRSLRPHALHGR